ncbi:MAG: OmpA family protein [Spirochaetes bacterium]|nr:OmpA family protein [Spirochaetota bacterium]MBU0955044.1 OmpA family protein [Spirochaetota bacterium]
MKKPIAFPRIWPAAFLLCAVLSPGFSQSAEDLQPFLPPEGLIQISERSDFSRYDNSVYTGHVYREARLLLERSLLPGGIISYQGEALVLQETLRDQRSSARVLDAAIPVSFRISAAGYIAFIQDQGYPILRGFPASPPQSVRQGQRWTGEAVVVVRPKSEAAATRIPVLVEYEYAGTGSWDNTPAFIIKARYAIRYRGDDRLGDPVLRSSSGGRTADIYISRNDGSTLFIRENVDDTFTYSGGSTVRLKGFILHFHKGSLPGDRARIASLLGGNSADPDAGFADPAFNTGEGSAAGSPSDLAASGSIARPSTSPLAGDSVTGPAAGNPAADTAPASAMAAALPAAASSGPPPFELAETARGMVMLLYDLRFAPDSDQLLPAELPRLDAIAAALKQLPQHSFLVEGHSADLGRPQGQYTLSADRARRIVDELTARGIPAGRFVYRGLGADKPIAPNDTEEQRARNRRVEITILE